jgi:LPXTG-site transpeptidase (sortase) family protein
MNADPKKNFSWKKGFVLSVVLGLLAGCTSIILQARYETFAQVSVAAEPISVEPTPLDATAAADGIGSSFYVPAAPVRLIIPTIGVDAAIQDVGMSWSGLDMGVPTNFTDVGWYKNGPKPGMPGSAVIDGHLDGRVVPQAIFYNLQNLKAGDMVNVVDASGTTLRFRVVGTDIYDYNATTTDIFAGDVSKSHLNLITCAGDWDKSQKLYNKRVVVFTDLVTTD